MFFEAPPPREGERMSTRAGRVELPIRLLLRMTPATGIKLLDLLINRTDLNQHFFLCLR